MQRQQQLRVDLPPQYFFAFDYSQSGKPGPAPSSNLIVESFDKGKYVLFPMARDTLIGRFENIGDLFDHVGPNKTLGAMQIDLVEFFYSFYFEANHEKDPFEGKPMPKDKTLRQLWNEGYTAIPLLEIDEVDLTNN